MNTARPAERVLVGPGCRVLVAGLGGGGVRAVERMAASWTDGPDGVAIDTDRRALETCRLARRVEIGRTLTQGIGTGGDPVVGKLAAEDDLGPLRDLLQDVDLLILVAGLGGGTGSGAAPVLAQKAQERGALVLCFAAMPFSFEDDHRQRCARAALRDLRLRSDAVVVQWNDRLLEMGSEGDGLTESLALADETLGVCVRSLWSLLTRPAVMNLNFADLRRLIESSRGTCVFGFGAGDGAHKADLAVQDILGSPLLGKGSVLATAAALLVNLTGGDDLTLAEVQLIMTRIGAVARRGARIMMGVCVDPAWQNRVAITVLAAEELAPDPEESGEPADGPAPAPPGDGKDGGEGTRLVKGRITQGSLDLEASSRGRFRNVDPTVYQGQDLDVPTFIRKGVKLSVDK